MLYEDEPLGDVNVRGVYDVVCWMTQMKAPEGYNMIGGAWRRAGTWISE